MGWRPTSVGDGATGLNSAGDILEDLELLA